ncbi:MAG TPA: DUF1800 domain-containing protein [Candidatus Acidoferrales bacterium]|nr:DUF1800 domain-containing protein [Candidatus Acidoferrales bacterium]
MVVGRVKFVILLLSVGLACSVPPLLADKKDKDKDKDKDRLPAGASNHMSDQRRASHALNRLTFGPRPGDVQRVMAIGVDKWIDLQLHPDKIDDSALNARLEPFRTLRMNAKELAEDFPDGQEINQVIKGKSPMPSEAALRMVYQVQIDRRQEKKERLQEAGKNTNSASDLARNVAVETPSQSIAAQSANATADDSAGVKPAPAPKLTPEDEQQARRREEQLYADLDVQQLTSLPADQRFNKVLGMSATAQLALADSLRGGKGQEFLEGLPPKQKETLLAMNNPAGVVTGELAQAKLLRATYSGRQLEQVMTDFWFNHFNVFMEKGVERLLVTSYERDVIRPRALGKFEDLLVAAAKSPAMLFYLDNWLSVGPDSAQAMGIPLHPSSPGHAPSRPRPNQGKRPSGLNENYGRELLELHTLSVSGGYTQRDVTEVAKVFTGWTIDKPYQGGGFKFDPRMHEPGPKFVLGHRIKPKGEGEGLEVLHRLATSPQTARFISLKLAERFVSDDPPPGLVDRMTKTFLKKKGDIREVLTVLFHSPEFWNDGAYRAKVKTPLEFVVSAVRATGAEVDDALPLIRQLNNMGMPLYGAQPPTGYSMKAGTWVSSSALLNRMNFALTLTSDKLKAVKVDAGQLAGSSPRDSNLALTTLENSLLAGDVSKQTHDSITAQIDEAAMNGAQQKQDKSGARKPVDASRSPDVSTIAGLLLGSPEFQRR